MSTPDPLAFLSQLGQSAQFPAASRYHEAILEAKKDIILKAFKEAGGNYVETARLLDVHPNYLHRLVRNLNLRPSIRSFPVIRGGSGRVADG